MKIGVDNSEELECKGLVIEQAECAIVKRGSISKGTEVERIAPWNKANSVEVNIGKWIVGMVGG